MLNLGESKMIKASCVRYRHVIQARRRKSLGEKQQKVQKITAIMRRESKVPELRASRGKKGEELETFYPKDLQQPRI